MCALGPHPALPCVGPGVWVVQCMRLRWGAERRARPRWECGCELVPGPSALALSCLLRPGDLSGFSRRDPLPGATKAWNIASARPGRPQLRGGTVAAAAVAPSAWPYLRGSPALALCPLISCYQKVPEPREDSGAHSWLELPCTGTPSPPPGGGRRAAGLSFVQLCHPSAPAILCVMGWPQPVPCWPLGPACWRGTTTGIPCQ